jgi:nucleoside-diphosphate-sugar epimerase
MMQQRVFITGGNGFIGSHIVRELLHHEIAVTCLVRKESNRTHLEGLPVTIAEGDITDKKKLLKLLHSYDAVIHCAALANDWSTFGEAYRTNVSGTMNLLEACRENGIDRIIITGSISSYGETPSLKIRDESCIDNAHYPYLFDRWFPSRMNNYRDTKAIATRQAVGFARNHGLNCTVLEPAFVYGEREFSTGFYEYVKSAQQGFPVAPGTKKNNFPVIYAGDLAKGYYKALEKQLPGVHRIIMVNPTAERMDRILALYCRYCGVRKPLPMPKWTMYPPAFVLELLYTIARSAHPPLLTRGRINMFVDNIAFSAEKAKCLLGFTATTPLEEGIGKTVAWYKEYGYL